MASKAVNTPFLRNIAYRTYAQACRAPKISNAVQTGRAGNGAFISACDNGSPVARVTVSFKAGSRYEPVNEPGLAHIVRASTGLTTKKEQSFILARKLQQIGGSLVATADREHMTYTVEVSQDHLDYALSLMSNTICQQEFRPWELSDNVDRIKYEINSLSPQVRAIDLLHKAAYRRGLGNSLFVPPRRIGNISTESLQHFVNNNFTGERCAVSIVGSSLEKTKSFADILQLGCGKPNDLQCKYYGGELRKEMGGELAHVALAIEGAKAGTKEALTLSIMAKAFGSGPSIKWGKSNSDLARTIGYEAPYAAAGFSLSYSDSGLFGIILSTPAECAPCVVKTAANILRKPMISVNAFRAAKNALKVQVLDAYDSYTTLAEELVQQSLYTGSAMSPLDLAAQIDSISESDVQKAISCSKMSMGAAGCLFYVPYLDEM